MNIETAQKLDNLLEQMTEYRATRKDPRCSVPKKLRNEIVAFMPDSGMNRNELGRKLGLTGSTLYRWSNKAKPQVKATQVPKTKSKPTMSLDYNVMSVQAEEVILKAVQERKTRAADGDMYSRVRKNLNAYRAGQNPTHAIASAIGELVVQLQQELETTSDTVRTKKRTQGRS